MLNFKIGQKTFGEETIAFSFTSNVRGSFIVYVWGVDGIGEWQYFQKYPSTVGDSASISAGGTVSGEFDVYGGLDQGYKAKIVFTSFSGVETEEERHFATHSTSLEFVTYPDLEFDDCDYESATINYAASDGLAEGIMFVLYPGDGGAVNYYQPIDTSGDYPHLEIGTAYIGGLQAGTTYTCYAYYYSDTISHGVIQDEPIIFTTLSKPVPTVSPTVNTSNITGTAATVSFSARDQSAKRLRLCVWDSYPDDQSKIYDSTFTMSSGYISSSVSLTGLNGGTPYIIHCWLINDYGNGPTRVTSFTTADIPSKWKWTSAVEAGAEVTTVKISDAVYKAYFLTAAEWNSFIDRIVSVGNYYGYSISAPSYAKVTPDTQMTTTPIIAALNLLQAIGARNVPSNPDPGESISAALINGMKDSLNSLL